MKYTISANNFILPHLDVDIICNFDPIYDNGGLELVDFQIAIGDNPDLGVQQCMDLASVVHAWKYFFDQLAEEVVSRETNDLTLLQVNEVWADLWQIAEDDHNSKLEWGAS